MDAGGGLLMMLLAGIDVVAHGLVALIPLAIWQRTRVAGFAMVAASYAAGAVMVLAAPAVFRMAGADVQTVLVFWRLLGLAVTALAAYGFWRIYRALRAPAPGG